MGSRSQNDELSDQRNSLMRSLAISIYECDRQTDRRTDIGRRPVPRLRIGSCGKNETSKKPQYMSRTRNVRIAIFNGSCVKQREVCWLCNVTASCDKRSWISNPSTPNTKRMTLPIQRTPGPAHRPYIRSARSAAEQRRHFRFAIGPPRTYADCAALPKCSTELGAICPLLKASKFSYRWQTARCICVNNFCLHNREIVLKTTSGCTQQY